MVGIIQEQHPDRCRLFMQWKEMNWPVMVDALDMLEVSVVPITLLIDEHGMVQRIAPFRVPAEKVLEGFLDGDVEPRDGRAMSGSRSPNLEALTRAAARGTSEAWRELAAALTQFGGHERLPEAVDAWERARKLEPEHGYTEFRLGVARRMLYDSPAGQPDDFARAVQAWGRAMKIDPNQYIWRRRVQQYGPRLNKPYPFYDWVGQARGEIEQRGEKPHALRVEPSGAELTRPARSFDASTDAQQPPDPEGRIHRDEGKLIAVHAMTAPSVIRPGESTRVHLEFRTNTKIEAHWNNEAKGMVVWVEPPKGWSVDRRRIDVANPPQPLSDEVRRVEFEVQAPAGCSADAELPAYALYYVCQADGPCLFRRQDIAVPVRFEESAR
jgi:hypothetical protein